MKHPPIRLLIDGIGLAAAEAASHPWVNLAAWLGASDEFDVYWLDRGHAPSALGIRYVPFPSHRKGACAADSMLIQKVCGLYDIEVFSSTGWTTPLATPMLMLIDPGILGWHSHGQQQLQSERELALAFSQAYLCSSESVRAALLERQPEISSLAASMARHDWTSPEASRFLPELGEQIVAMCARLGAQGRSGRYEPFFSEWRRLRMLQATVDV